MLRLMIVDDEQIIREALSQMIDYESIGYKLIATAKNGMEAYDIICDDYPDVVITDIRMPILNGLDLIERSIKSDSHITFILLSGYNDFEYAKQAMKYGVRYYLLKPTDKNELVESLVSIRKERHEEEESRKMQQQDFFNRPAFSPGTELYYGSTGAPGFLFSRIP
uniref:response regulator n=1 Tax=Clostridium sp. NkU-1 TaxID=1095009 RepID=UPI0006D24F77